MNTKIFLVFLAFNLALALPRGRRVKRVLPDFENLENQLEDLKKLPKNSGTLRRFSLTEAKNSAKKGQLLLKLDKLINDAEELKTKTRAEMLQKRKPLKISDILYLVNKSEFAK